ncbi:MAG: DUF1801 domain-containing protein [Deltaproteobacteria bacterium]
MFPLPGGVRRDAAVDAWFTPRGELGAIARRWFEVMRAQGDDVVELLHDDQPTACVGDAPFAYVNTFKAHVNVGFFRGTELSDPAGLLEGTGKFMRHVKLRPERPIDEGALDHPAGDAAAPRPLGTSLASSLTGERELEHLIAEAYAELRAAL